MLNEIAVLERQLVDMTPTFEQLLAGSGVPAARVIRTVVVSIERQPKLLECTRQSVINSAITFGCLQLECDGPTGQGWMLPFAKRAQSVIGYKGYNTLAGRSGFTVNATVVREGDVFKEIRGTRPEIIHEPILGNEGRIIGTYATATSLSRPPVVAPALSIQEVLAVKHRSPGAKMPDSPWNDEKIGFRWMTIKTAIRTLWKFMPLNLGSAAVAMEEIHEVRQVPTYIHPEHGVIADRLPPPESTGEPAAFIIIKSDGSERVSNTIEQWEGGIALALQRIRSPDQCERFRERMDPVFQALENDHHDAVNRARDGIADLIKRLDVD